MNPNQIASLVRTLLKVSGAVLVHFGYFKLNTVLNLPDVVGALSVFVGCIWSHLSHPDDPGASSPVREVGQPGLNVKRGNSRNG
jgi:hypothetical protein